MPVMDVSPTIGVPFRRRGPGNKFNLDYYRRCIFPCPARLGRATADLRKAICFRPDNARARDAWRVLEEEGQPQKFVGCTLAMIDVYSILVGCPLHGSHCSPKSSVIWKSIRSCTKLLEIQIAKGLYCKDSEHAEGIGLFLAVKRPKELGIRTLDVVTDNEANCNIMMGKMDVYRNKSLETCMAFIQATKDYDICKCRREPKEMISHVNDLAKMAYSIEIDMLELREIIEPKSPQF